MNDVTNRILRRLSTGEDFKAACRAVGISRQTGYRLRKRDPWFDAQVKRLLSSAGTDRSVVFERKRLEAEADLREKQREDVNLSPGPVERQDLPIPDRVMDYAPDAIQYEPTLKPASDPDFKPGFQPAWRVALLDMRIAREREEKRREFYSGPFNWGKPFPG